MEPTEVKCTCGKNVSEKDHAWFCRVYKANPIVRPVEPQPRPEEFAEEFAKLTVAAYTKKEWTAPVVSERRVNLAVQQLQRHELYFNDALARQKGECLNGSPRRNTVPYTNSTGVGDHLKKDHGKPPLSLIPRSAVEAEAEVLAFGAKKYATHGWREGMDWSRLIDAALRHLQAYNDGEDRDPETGLLHLAHVKCCMSFLIEYATYGIGHDNRYKRDKV